jgi:putative transposase
LLYLYGLTLSQGGFERVMHFNLELAIVLEDLNVSGMVKNRRLSRAISLQGWREFRVLCEGKSEKHGREFVTINRWEPTSQVCSDCGFR